MSDGEVIDVPTRLLRQQKMLTEFRDLCTANHETYRQISKLYDQVYSRAVSMSVTLGRLADSVDGHAYVVDYGPYEDALTDDEKLYLTATLEQADPKSNCAGNHKTILKNIRTEMNVARGITKFWEDSGRPHVTKAMEGMEKLVEKFMLAKLQNITLSPTPSKEEDNAPQKDRSDPESDDSFLAIHEVD